MKDFYEHSNELYTDIIEELSDSIIVYGVMMKLEGYQEGYKEGFNRAKEAMIKILNKDADI